MLKHREYHLKGMLYSLTILIRQVIDSLNKKEGKELLEDRFTELKKKMNESLGVIRKYKEYNNVGKNDDSTEDDEDYDFDVNDVFLDEKCVNYRLQGALDSAIFFSRQVIHFINTEANSEDVINGLDKLIGEMDKVRGYIDSYIFYCITDQEKVLADKLRLARKYAIEAGNTMAESDLKRSSGQFREASSGIKTYYASYLQDENFYDYLYYQDDEETYGKEKYDKKLDVTYGLGEFIDFAEKAIYSMDFDSIKEAGAFAASVAANISSFLMLKPKYIGKIPIFVNIVWELDKMAEIIEWGMRNKQKNYKSRPKEEVNRREPEARYKLIEIFKSVVYDASRALYTMDDSYLGRVRYELRKTNKFTAAFGLLLKDNDCMMGEEYINSERNSFLESLEKFGCMIKSDNEEIIKNKFIRIRKVMEIGLDELGKSYEYKDDK